MYGDLILKLNKDSNASKAEMQESAQEHVVQLNKDNNGSKAEMHEPNCRASHELLERFENATQQNNSWFQEQLERVDALVQQVTGSSLPIPHVAEIASISVEHNGDEVDASVVQQRFLSSASRGSRSETNARLESWCTFNMFKKHNDLGHASEIQSINEFANVMLRLSLNEEIKEIPYCALYPESSVGVHGVEVPAPVPVSTEAANSEMVDKGMEVGHNADLAGVVEAQADEIQDLKEMDEQVSEQGEHEIQALKEMDEEVSELDSDLCALRVEMDVHNIPATPKVLDRMQALESQLQMLSVSLSPAASPSPAATPVKLAFELSEVA